MIDSSTAPVTATPLTEGTTVVTGAADGLGRRTAELLAAAGGDLVLVDLDGEKLGRAASALRGQGVHVVEIVGDVSAEATAEAVASAVRELPRPLARIFLAAGIDPLGARSVVETTVSQWDAVMAVNVRAAFLLTRLLLPKLVANGGGSIVLTASSAAHRAARDEAAYTVSKTALLGLARSIAVDFGSSGVRSNCVSPGPMEAVMTDRRAEMTPEALTERQRAVEAVVPLGRAGGYDDVARSVLFLLSPESAYVTGTALVVDGGLVS